MMHIGRIKIEKELCNNNDHVILFSSIFKTHAQGIHGLGRGLGTHICLNSTNNLITSDSYPPTLWLSSHLVFYSPQTLWIILIFGCLFLDWVNLGTGSLSELCFPSGSNRLLVRLNALYMNSYPWSTWILQPNKFLWFSWNKNLYYLDVFPSLQELDGFLYCIGI